jgi:hypothetical protein
VRNLVLSVRNLVLSVRNLVLSVRNLRKASEVFTLVQLSEII